VGRACAPCSRSGENHASESPLGGGSARAQQGPMRCDPEQIEQIVELACALHDTGKLTVRWQEVAWRWQRDKDERLRASGQIVGERPDVPLAHTKFDPVADRDYRWLPAYKFPNHAVEGAFAVEDAVCAVMAEIVGETAGLIGALAVVSAIARHHAPHARSASLFDLDRRADSLVAGLLGSASVGLRLKACESRVDSGDFPDTLFSVLQEEHQPAWPLNSYLARRVRLADQASLAG